MVTWPSRKLKICIQTHVEKFTDFKNASRFDLRRKITQLSRKNRFRTVASPGACERLALLNWRSSSIHSSSLWLILIVFVLCGPLYLITTVDLGACMWSKTSCVGGRHTKPPPQGTRMLRQRLALGGGVEYGVVHVVTWTANQSCLVTLTFDLLNLKVVSESRVTWATLCQF